MDVEDAAEPGLRHLQDSQVSGEDGEVDVGPLQQPEDPLRRRARIGLGHDLCGNRAAPRPLEAEGLGVRRDHQRNLRAQLARVDPLEEVLERASRSGEEDSQLSSHRYAPSVSKRARMRRAVRALTSSARRTITAGSAYSAGPRNGSRCPRARACGARVGGGDRGDHHRLRHHVGSGAAEKVAFGRRLEVRPRGRRHDSAPEGDPRPHRGPLRHL